MLMASGLAQGIRRRAWMCRVDRETTQWAGEGCMGRWAVSGGCWQVNGWAGGGMTGWTPACVAGWLVGDLMGWLLTLDR